MLDIILIATIITVWAIAMVWAYWDNGGIKGFKKILKRILNK